MTKRCAIYTRKSTDERLDMEFNTLDAQREACEAYITSQKSEGWVALAQHYDDGGFSGGTLERPALDRLIEDIKANKIDIIVVYKIDRLTRSLMDFAKLVEIFDQHEVTFVSITQSFNTTTSMGRLTLNVLLSFAQFEREVASERIRDKIAASKARGMWMGGRPPLGFDIADRRLVQNEDAETAKMVFELYLELGCVRKLKIELERRGVRSKERISKRGIRYGGEFFSRGALYSLLKNPVYIGKISHKGKLHDGQHDAIITDELWDKVQSKLITQSPEGRGKKKHSHRNLLTGILFGESGNPYTPVYTNKGNKKYRYYLNKRLNQDLDHPNKSIARLPAHEIESLVERSVRKHVHKLCKETHKPILEHVLKHQVSIPTFDLVRKCVKGITIYFDYINIEIIPSAFSKLADKYLGVNILSSNKLLEIKVLYQTKRVQDGAIVIEPERRDVFDLPSAELKKLIEGIVWRDEHFNGTKMNDIAKREGYSDRHIRKMIISSFDTLVPV